MKYRLLSITLLFALLLSLTGSAWASRSDVTALVQVFVPDAAAMQRFAATGLPTYTFLNDTLLAGVPASRLWMLESADLRYYLLDDDMRGGWYYLTFIPPKHTAPDWSSFGRPLLITSTYALLRSTPEAADLLAASGMDLRLVTFTPKPLPNLEAEADLFSDVITPDPLVQQLIDQVTTPEIYALTAGLSGANPVTVGGEQYTILTRHTYSGEPIHKATQHVGEYLSDLGLSVEYHTWKLGNPPNVIGEMHGLVNPQAIYIIGGHLDDMPADGVAPGADDNASGSVAALLAGKIFSQYYWGCTLRFALWTGEEQGLLGSEVYAERSRLQGENILGYLNLDMIAWDSDELPGIELHATTSIPATRDLAQLFADVTTAYSLQLEPEIIPSGTGASDHASFWDNGFVSILAIEDFTDFNDYYHTPNDLLQYINMDYYTDFVKASLATFAHMSSCRLPTATLTGTVSVAGSSEPVPDAALVFTDSLSNTFTALTDASGAYTALLPSGAYTVTVSAVGYQPVALSSVTLLSDTLVHLDFELTELTEPFVIYLPLSLRNTE